MENIWPKFGPLTAAGVSVGSLGSHPVRRLLNEAVGSSGKIPGVASLARAAGAAPAGEAPVTAASPASARTVTITAEQSRRARLVARARMRNFECPYEDMEDPPGIADPRGTQREEAALDS